MTKKSEDKYYIDPNSGLAPQPGGYAGAVGAETGHAIPADAAADGGVEQKRPLNELGYDPVAIMKGKSVQEIADEAEKADKAQSKSSSEKEEAQAKEDRLAAIGNPKKFLADLDEGDSASTAKPEFTEEEAVDAKALELQAVNMEESPEDKGLVAEEDEKPAEGNSRSKAPAKKTAAKKAGS